MNSRVKKRNLLCTVMLTAAIPFFSQAQVNSVEEKTEKKVQVLQESNSIELKELKAKFQIERKDQKEKALKLAKEKGWEIEYITPEGAYAQLQRVENGNPVYYVTTSNGSAQSTRTNHLNSQGSLGLGLEGEGLTLHIWDNGVAKTTHQEYGNRYSIGDTTTVLSDHSAHVAGIVMSSGVEERAKGMAPKCSVIGYDFTDDLVEATVSASNGMLISSHSYISIVPVLIGSSFGSYNVDAKNWDELLYNAPHYLMVAAAGNSGIPNPNPNGGGVGDEISGFALAKNNLTVANYNSANVSFTGNLLSKPSKHIRSSVGPSDDLRIKPDICGDGDQVYSTYSINNSSYSEDSGTSMATPNVAGSLLLLQEHYQKSNGQYMKAATLKGLVLHTADDLETAGPDARSGWGLLNTRRAAQAISGLAKIEELNLTQGTTYSFTVESDGVSPLMASICWTDLPGSVDALVNSSLADLVNDLDIRIVKNGVTHFPYKLTSISTNGTGDNLVDPYERIDIENASGTYTIVITHKGILQGGGSQNYSLIVSGTSDLSIACDPLKPMNIIVENFSQLEAALSWTEVYGATYELRYRKTGTSIWTNLIEDSIFSQLTVENNSTYEAQVRSQCQSGIYSSYSPMVNFTTPKYCIPTNLSFGVGITNVELPDIGFSNSSSTTPYTDFTTQQIVVNSGQSYSVKLTTNVPFGVPVSFIKPYWNVWVDFDDNGLFDNTEKVISIGPVIVSGPGTVDTTGVISIPAGLNGQFRMRVSSGNQSFPESCNTTTFGSETEDYTLNVGNSTQDTQAPTAPLNLSASNITQTTATLSWSPSTDNVGVTGYDLYYGVTLVSSLIGTNFSATGLVAGTSYTGLTVKAKDAAGNVSVASNSLSFTTATATVVLTYCASAGQDVTGEYISKVELETINNSSTAQLYSDFTSLSTNLNKGNSYTIIVTPAWTGSAYAEGYSVWIDYNQDGDFTDAGEQVWTKAASTSTPVSGSFTIPSGTTSGSTRMRVSMKYNGVPTSCETFQYGEVEDYTVNIGNSTQDTQAPTAPTNLTAGSITQTSTVLSWTVSTDNVGVTGYDVYYGTTLFGSVASTTFSVVNLTAATTYNNFTVKAKDAAGNVSAISNVLNLTTLSPSDTQAPTAPLNLSVSNITETAATLSWSPSTDNVGVTGYDLYSGATLVSSLIGTNFNLTGLVAGTSYSLTVKAKDAAENVSVASNSLEFTTTAVSVVLSYCASAGQSVTDEYISNVELETINNSSTAQLYSDFTSLSTNLDKGNSYTITVTPTWTGTAYPEGYSVWIDYNQDGDFTDAGEQVWTKAASTSTQVSGSFTIPSGATSGSTRMRVSMKWNGIATSCESFGYGEVEDYTVNIGNSTQDTQAPTAPLNLSVSNITETAATLSWSPSTDNVGVTEYDVYRGAILLGSTTGNNSNLTGLVAGTSYTGFTVKAKDAAGNVSIASNSLDFTTTTAAVVLTYCASAGQSVTDEYISKVELATINNSSNAQLYSDFTSLSTNLDKGNSYTITVTPAWTGTAYVEGYSVWIDYNQDGDFTDAGEQVWTKAASTTTPVSGSFTIPAGATSGSTRMRVSMKWNGIPTSCESFGYGEVEDYTVNIVSSSAFSIFASISEEESEIGGLSVFPNPINNGLLSVVYTNYKADLETRLIVRDVFGRVIRTIEVASKTTRFNIDDLISGVYLITIETDEGSVTNKFIKK